MQNSFMTPSNSIYRVTVFERWLKRWEGGRTSFHPIYEDVCGRDYRNGQTRLLHVYPVKAVDFELSSFFSPHLFDLDEFMPSP